MKALVVFYLRTGTTKKVAEEIAEKLKADVEEIIDTVDRSGPMGWLYAGRDGMKRNLTKLKRMKTALEDYDLVIVGTPIWSWNISAPVRTYPTAFKSQIKKVAFFCTMGGQGDEKAFSEMSGIISQEPVAKLALTTKEVASNDHLGKIEEFVSVLK